MSKLYTNGKSMKINENQRKSTKISTYLQIKVVEFDEIDSLIGILVVLLVVVPIEENSSPILRNATDREGKKSLVAVSLSSSTHLPDIPVSLADLGGVGICVVHVYAKALDALLSQLLVRMYPQKPYSVLGKHTIHSLP